MPHLENDTNTDTVHVQYRTSLMLKRPDLLVVDQVTCKDI
jgi:hypothetical protein